MLSKVHSQPATKAEQKKTAIEVAVQRFRATKRLSADDQRTAAINLGKLAASLDQDNPAKAARRIAEESKLAGVLDKRKRFFRLPNEEAPIAAKDGTYNANPEKFLTLARAAGRLLSGSSDKGLQAMEEERAQRMLLVGTSFLPTYMPETQAEKSVKAILEEYAVRLAEAIEQRTRITELWKALDATPLSLKISSDPLPPSVYGVDANFPSDLAQSKYAPLHQHAQLEPALSPVYGAWDAEPSLFLGTLVTGYEILGLEIPKEKSELFPAPLADGTWRFSEVTEQRNAWLESIGFDVEQHTFVDEELGMDQQALTKFRIAYVHNVSLSVRQTAGKKVAIEINIWNSSKEGWFFPDFFLVGRGGNFSDSLTRYVQDASYQWPMHVVTVGPAWPDDYDEDSYVEQYGGNCILTEAAVDNRFHENPKVLLLGGPSEEEYWADEVDFHEYEKIRYFNGWIDDAIGARILLGAANISFIPSIEYGSPKAGAARAGSLAASIIENAVSAPEESKISQLLIKRVERTAEVGLRFINAMVETSRSALTRI